MTVHFKDIIQNTAKDIALKIATKEKRSWYTRVPKKMWEDYLSGCTPTERCVYITLKMFENKEHTCYPSIRRIASILKISTSTTSIAIESLRTKEFILKESRRGRHNFYKVC